MGSVDQLISDRVLTLATISPKTCVASSGWTQVTYRLAVPAPRFHTVRYAGVLAPASKMRPKIVPGAALAAKEVEPDVEPKRKGSRYWPWAQLMARAFALDARWANEAGGTGALRHTALESITLTSTD